MAYEDVTYGTALRICEAYCTAFRFCGRPAPVLEAATYEECVDMFLELEQRLVVGSRTNETLRFPHISDEFGRLRACAGYVHRLRLNSSMVDDHRNSGINQYSMSPVLSNQASKLLRELKTSLCDAISLAKRKLNQEQLAFGHEFVPGGEMYHQEHVPHNQGELFHSQEAGDDPTVPIIQTWENILSDITNIIDCLCRLSTYTASLPITEPPNLETSRSIATRSKDWRRMNLHILLPRFLKLVSNRSKRHNLKL